MDDVWAQFTTSISYQLVSQDLPTSKWTIKFILTNVCQQKTVGEWIVSFSRLRFAAFLCIYDIGYTQLKRSFQSRTVQHHS
jgi:hypothetical protein